MEECSLFVCFPSCLCSADVVHLTGNILHNPNCWQVEYSFIMYGIFFSRCLYLAILPVKHPVLTMGVTESGDLSYFIYLYICPIPKQWWVNIKLGAVPWWRTAPTTRISSPKYLGYSSACRFWRMSVSIVWLYSERSVPHRRDTSGCGRCAWLWHSPKCELYISPLCDR
jgi:hypothetical protein